ncbi:MAG TPA: Gfo/Idh/MocA family oxidoreductase [Chitinophagaceae bacterium]|jgi:predicted dehydrogenase|nr:Gfo/Idh/MocA family oxidoreductase [Chitinophagaceae bacterium]
MNGSKIRWGILGCGRIARKFAADLRLVTDAELTAIASRNKETLELFAKDFQCKHLHNSYEALAANKEVDVIYIATPHSHHYEHTMLCLNHDKAVLCEKAFAINRRQAKEMIKTATERKVFLMEALWTKFLPHYKKLQELLQQNILGDIKSVLVNFGFKTSDKSPQRLFDPLLGGGTLLDIGIYNVFITVSVLGRPDSIEATMTPSPTRVDEQIAILFKYNSGAMAQLFSSFTTNLPVQAEINGTEGCITLTTRFYEPSATIQLSKRTPYERAVIAVEKEAGFGYQYEARHVNECLKKRLIESPVMTHADTLLLMEILDSIRNKARIEYPQDQE